MMVSSWFATREHQAGVWLAAAPPHEGVSDALRVALDL